MASSCARDRPEERQQVGVRGPRPKLPTLLLPCLAQGPWQARLHAIGSQGHSPNTKTEPQMVTVAGREEGALAGQMSERQAPSRHGGHQSSPHSPVLEGSQEVSPQLGHAQGAEEPNAWEDRVRGPPRTEGCRPHGRAITGKLQAPDTPFLSQERLGENKHEPKERVGMPAQNDTATRSPGTELWGINA